MKSMTISVRCLITREHFIWAVSYLRSQKKSKPFKDKISKIEVLNFLKDQLSQYGTEFLYSEQSMDGLKEECGFAEKWLLEHYPALE